MIREYLAILLVILLIAGIRFRLKDFPLERDEGEYAYAGQLILQGIPPYQLAYNMKLPGTYAAYATIMAIFGQTRAGIHIGVILVNSACIFLIFLITRQIASPTAGIVAGAIFGLCTIRPMLLGLAGHATHFVALAALACLYLLRRAIGTQHHWLYFLSGLCAGLALLMKQPGVFFGIFAAMYLCWAEWPKPSERTPFIKKLVAYSAGTILPYAVTCVILWRAGVFQKFWFWTVWYAREYGSESSASFGLHQFANRMELQKEHFGVILFFVVFGMAAFLWNQTLRPHAGFVLGLLASSFLAISAGLYYRGHYFIMMYPVIALLVGVGVSSSVDLLRNLSPWKFLAIAPILFFGFAFANVLFAERQLYFLASPNEASRYAYGANPFPEAIEIGKFIQAQSDPDAKVVVLGSEPEIYFYAHRHSATGYIYTYPLVEEQKYGSVMQSEMIRDIETNKPEFLILVMTHESWETRRKADTRIFDWIDSYIPANYSVMGIADGGNHDVYRWGAEVVTYRPRRPEYILVYRRFRQVRHPD